VIPLSDIFGLLGAARNSFPGVSPVALKLKAKMVREGLMQGPSLRPFLHPKPGAALARAMAQRPQMLGVLIWPYQCADWEPGERLAHIRSHYDEIDRIGAPLCFNLDEQLIVTDLSDISAGLRVVIDQPQWFMREGGLVVNLFVDSFRAFSLAFSFDRTQEDQLLAMIGGIQGRNRQDALDLYRQLTKDFHGLRPRDLLLEVFRVLCRHFNVSSIRAVTQSQRHHLHPFFGGTDLAPDYDAIWEDRQGVRADKYFYSLPVAPETRDITSVKPNKRALYRKRFAFLENLENRLIEGLGRATPVRFVDT